MSKTGWSLSTATITRIGNLRIITFIGNVVTSVLPQNDVVSFGSVIPVSDAPRPFSSAAVRMNNDLNHLFATGCVNIRSTGEVEFLIPQYSDSTGYTYVGATLVYAV